MCMAKTVGGGKEIVQSSFAGVQWRRHHHFYHLLYSPVAGHRANGAAELPDRCRRLYSDRLPFCIC